MQNITRKAASTDVSVVIRIVDSTDGSPETGVTSATPGLALEYRREGATSTAITETDLTNLNDAHSDGGMKHVANGYYRLDVPDAAVAAGATGCLVHGTVTGMVVIGSYINLTQMPADVTHWLGTAAATPTVAGVPEVDVTHWIGTAAATPTVAGVPEVDVTHWIGTAAATPTVAGVPEVDVTHWLGTAAATPTTAGVPEVDVTFVNGAAASAASAQLGVNVVNVGGAALSTSTAQIGVNLVNVAGAAVSTTTAQLGVNAVQISGDATAADNLETAFDDTAGPVPWLGISDQGTAQSATATTVVLRAATPFGADNAPIGSVLAVYGSTQGYWQFRSVTDYVTSTDTATVDTWDVTPSGTITYKVFGSAPASVGSPVPANVTHWYGAAVPIPTVAGVPETDITHVSGAATDTASAQLGVNVVQAGGTAWGSGAITDAAVATGAITAAKFSAGAIDAAAIATDAIGASELSDAAVDKILDEVIVGGYTLRQLLRGFGSALLSKASGLDTTTATFRSVDDTKNVIVATVDANGNRTAITLDLT